MRPLVINPEGTRQWCRLSDAIKMIEPNGLDGPRIRSCSDPDHARRLATRRRRYHENGGKPKKKKKKVVK